MHLRKSGKHMKLWKKEPREEVDQVLKYLVQRKILQMKIVTF